MDVEDQLSGNLDQENGSDVEDAEDLVSALEDEQAEEDDDRAWFVIHCYSGNEDKVRHNIMQRI